MRRTQRTAVHHSSTLQSERPLRRAGERREAQVIRDEIEMMYVCLVVEVTVWSDETVLATEVV